MAPTQQQTKEAKAKLISGGKAPKARVARYLKKHVEAHLEEGAKSTLLLKGIRCSQAMSLVLKDLRASLAPNVKLMGKNNLIVPFDDTGHQSVEFLATKNDCALFAIASHNKKRPNNLTIGRTFDRRILDICELGILRYKALDDYAGVPKKRLGSKPMMLFVGDTWHQDPTCRRLQNLWIDFYRGDPVKTLVLSGLDHVMIFTAVITDNALNGFSSNAKDKTILIYQRTYYCKLKQDPNGGDAPLPYLTSCGPDLDMEVRRTQFASPDVWKMAMKQPEGTKKKKVKNQSSNLFGETLGRLHLEKQNLDKMGGRKSKALRKAARWEKEEEMADIENDLANEKETLNTEMKQVFGFHTDELD